MMGSMAAFVLNDTMTKTTGGAVPLFQLLFLRGVILAGAIGSWSQSGLVPKSERAFSS